MSRAVMQQALEALEEHGNPYQGHTSAYRAAITALKQALAEPQKRVGKPRNSTTPLGRICYEAYARSFVGTNRWDIAAEAVRQALAEPEQEPVAWMDIDEHGQRHGLRYYSDGNRDEVPLYTAPTPRKPLTDEEIDRVTDQQWAQNNHKPIYAAHRAYARAIERAHGIGEQT